MSSIDRRSLLAGAGAAAVTATVASPALVYAQGAVDTDILIVGAGAAGVAAARRVLAANRKCLIVEAGARVGGRCATDTTTFGAPFDRGAQTLYGQDANPLIRLAPATGLDVYTAPPGQKVRIGRRYARESEIEDFLSVLVRSTRAIIEAARGKTDVDALKALPKDLYDWRATVEFLLGPLQCGRDLAEVSAVDLSKAAERDVGAYCRQGLGALVAKLAEPAPMRLSTPVTRIESWGRGRVYVETPRGGLTARAVIVTASPAFLAAGKIRFDPELPKRHVDALGRIKLGSYDHVVFEFANGPIGDQSDDLIFERADGPRSGAIRANIAGSTLTAVQVGGRLGRDLSARGESAMVDYATEWLVKLYGADIRKTIRRSTATRWNDEPFVLGAMSSVGPGGQGARAILAEPLRDRIWFAGEATHESLWGTVAGAWLSGERAAEAAMRKLGWITTPRETPAPAAQPTRPSRPRPQVRPVEQFAPRGTPE